MPSNLARLSAVARSALPRLSRKLRPYPSRTLTTSPIWPSLATRSSKMTSIFVLLEVVVEGMFSGHWEWWWSPAQEALAEAEHGIGKAERHQGEHRPDENHGDHVG